jgi:F-type H+-transporting ATPase subunit delta
MKNPTLVRKYTEGLVAAMADEAEFRRVLGEIEGFAALVAGRDNLRRALENPFLKPRMRAGIVGEVLERTGAGAKTVRFLLLLVEHGRLEILPDIAAAAPEAWNERRGIATLEVASVVPLTDGQKVRLEAVLERLEGRPVSLGYRIDPEIIGGLALRKGNVVYDVSVEGDLMRLKEKITEGQ